MRVDNICSYDDRGNITSVNMYEYSAGDLGEATYVINYGYTDPSWPDLMTSYYGTDIVYDDLGNPQNWAWGETLTWQNGRLLAKYEGYENTVNYTYNADGLRTSKSGDRTTEYFIVDGQYIGEVTKVGYMTYNVAYLYDENGAPAGLNVNGSEFFFVKNIQGDVLGIVNPNGYLVVTYRYDAYGNTISMKDSSGEEITNPQAIANVNPFRYRGYMYDIETGFYLTGTRYYDPEIGRFINADGYIQTPNGDMTSTNMFAYCGNNPVNRYDPNGEAFLTATICGVAAWKIGAAFVGLIATFIVADSIAKNPPVIPPISLPKIEIRPKTETKDTTKDIAPTLPKRPAKDPVHHIVAKADPRAAESRQILRDVGIEPLTDPKNLVVLPQSYHASLHTTAYHNYVTEQLRLVAGDKAGVEATLASLKAEILARSAAGIRWD